MLFDVPAESGGALTILNEYYEIAKNDTNNEWFFILSTPLLKETENIKVLNYPWVKKSWIHRLYFDFLVAYKLVEKFHIDEVYSLQNVIIPNLKVRQNLYLHQPLPFVGKKYKIYENFQFWIYQNIISRLIFKSIRLADKIIVQTNWIMQSAIEITRVSRNKFILKHPELAHKVKKKYTPLECVDQIFFYPANGLAYKNHEVIINACRILKLKGISNYKVILTLKGNENTRIVKLRRIISSENLPIEFVGVISIDAVYEYYSKAVLIFPSYIESFGLPILEAKLHETPIIVSDCAYSREILISYNKVNFFHYNDSSALAKLIYNQLNNKI